jgi:branched-subunit amino acid transport protein AzlD
MTAPTLSPNVRIEDPRVRKIVGNVLGWAVIALLVVTIFDVNIVQLDLAWFSVPAAAIVAALQALFQLLVTSPNVAAPANPAPPAA